MEAFQNRLLTLMERLPLLGAHGFVPFRYFDKVTPEVRSAEVERERAKLVKDVSKIEEIHDWLKANIAPIKTVYKGNTSYGLKHVVEAQIGYITNGSFIAAAILAGYTYKQEDARSPNVWFGMSKKDIGFWQDQRNRGRQLDTAAR